MSLPGLKTIPEKCGCGNANDDYQFMTLEKAYNVDASQRGRHQIASRHLWLDDRSPNKTVGWISMYSLMQHVFHREAARRRIDKTALLRRKEADTRLLTDTFV